MRQLIIRQFAMFQHHVGMRWADLWTKRALQLPRHDLAAQLTKASCMASSARIKIAEQADQNFQDSSRIHAIKGVEQFTYLRGGTLGHEEDLSKPATPNQFGKKSEPSRCQGSCHRSDATSHRDSRLAEYHSVCDSTHCAWKTAKGKSGSMR